MWRCGVAEKPPVTNRRTARYTPGNRRTPPAIADFHPLSFAAHGPARTPHQVPYRDARLPRANVTAVAHPPSLPAGPSASHLSIVAHMVHVTCCHHGCISPYVWYTRLILPSRRDTASVQAPPDICHLFKGFFPLPRHSIPPTLRRSSPSSGTARPRQECPAVIPHSIYVSASYPDIIPRAMRVIFRRCHYYCRRPTFSPCRYCCFATAMSSTPPLLRRQRSSLMR